jgi:transketolase
MAVTGVVLRLEEKAADIRKQLCDMTYHIGHAHLGGALSMCDFTVALYYHFMNFNPEKLDDPDRDRLYLSKGHNGCLIYNIFADMGLYTKEFLYNGYNKIDGKFGQHPNRKYIPGFEASTGSLGHGLSIAVGAAHAGRMDKRDYRVFCIVGDGELQEGSNWEAIMFAGHNKYGNLVAVVDKNGVQGNGFTSETINMEPMALRWKAFGWDTIEIEDGNDMEQVVAAFSSLPDSNSQMRRAPICIIANTLKGYGIDFMEGQPKWHAGGLSEDDLKVCKQMIDAKRMDRRQPCRRV